MEHTPDLSDAVVELNRSDYGSDESRKALKQSILIKNGYTQADFDKYDADKSKSLSKVEFSKWAEAKTTAPASAPGQ